MKSAQKSIKQIVREPLEILKTAGVQVAGRESVEISQKTPGEESNNEKIREENLKTQDNLKSSRRMEAYQRELTDIKKETLFKELQRRITLGDEIPLENYPDLSIEQKQVLKAQMEAVRERRSAPNDGNVFVEPPAKKGRRLFNFGKKQEVKRQQQRVENIVPPSG